MDTKVELLHITPLKVADIAIGVCWDKQREQDIVDLERMDRVANKFQHLSTVEHITANFFISGMSRLCLQELARHRIASISVESTRYTLKALKNEESFCSYDVNDGKLKIIVSNEQILRACEYLQPVDNLSVMLKAISALEQLRLELLTGTSNDIAKYCLPESFKTKLSWSVNIRSLRNFLFLRTDKTAHFEIRDLARKIYDAIPEEYKFLLSEMVKIDS